MAAPDLCSGRLTVPRRQALQTRGGRRRTQRHGLGQRRTSPQPARSTCPGSPVSRGRGQSRLLPALQLQHPAPASGQGEQDLSTAASQLQTPPRCRLGRPRLLSALTIVVDPGWLQELHCSAAAGLKPEPCSSARLGHGAAAASSHAARPPAAAHPSPQLRRAIAGPRTQPPPQPPPALGRRRRRHSRIPCAAPPPAAPGQRRKSRRAPAKSPRRETAPYADGAASVLQQAGRAPVKLVTTSRTSRSRRAMQGQGSVQISSSTSAAANPA